MLALPPGLDTIVCTDDRACDVKVICAVSRCKLMRYFDCHIIFSVRFHFDYLRVVPGHTIKRGANFVAACVNSVVPYCIAVMLHLCRFSTTLSFLSEGAFFTRDLPGSGLL